MKQGHFLFIKDEFFLKHDLDGLLMKNKEDGINRPCFYTLQDRKEPCIFWCVPISSKVEKYERIVQHKISRQQEKGYKTPKHNTIRFGEVLGQKRAFLIQNIFPVTAAYISSVYIDRNTHNPVTIDPTTERDIIANATNILRLVFRGHKNLVFSDIQKTYANLIAELHPDQRRDDKSPPASTLSPTTQSQSIKDRLATAQEEANRRNEARQDTSHKPHQDHEL